MRIIVSILFFLGWGSALVVSAEPKEISQKGCRECHRFSSDESQPKQGPDLFYSGNKFQKKWLKKFLQSPEIIHEVTFSPKLDLVNGKSKVIQTHAKLTKNESERGTNFLMTLQLSGLELGKINEEPLSKAQSARAKISFERTFGCISCHRALNLIGRVRGGVSGPSLVNSGLRLKPDWIFHWLKTPQRFMREGRMPLFNLDEEEAIRITKYILSIRKKS